MQLLMRLRPSNLIIVAALPFIVYLFASSVNYQRSLRAIIGVENGSSAFVPGFLALAVAFIAGLAVVVFSRASSRSPRLVVVAAGISLATAVVLATTIMVHPFAASVVANAVDPFTSDLVVQGVTPRRLTDAANLMVRGQAAMLLRAYLGVTIVALGMFFIGAGRETGNPMQRFARLALAAVNGVGLVFILLFAHIAFAAGVATTIRAAIAAYILAAMMGLLWVGLLKLKYSWRADLTCIAATILMVCAATWFLLQPRDSYVLVGSLAGKVAVTSGTPSGILGAVRYGQFPGGPDNNEVPLRTFRGAREAIDAIGKIPDVSAALVPAAMAPDGLQVLWRTEALNDRDKAFGITIAVLAIVLGLLTFGGHIHRRHPLSIGSEFIVDTIRGIPMLVIVLYVGLPLAGALKDATQGVVDPPNLVRGIAAMALAYSAYLAEIFRSGINAIPAGQIEAAHSLGLNGWRTARLVVLPQAFRIIIPPLGNELIAILKDTSLLSILSIRDITQRMREFQSASFLPFAPYNSAAIFYIFLTLAAASLVSTIERKYDIKHR
ncbi:MULTISPECIES: amino acid ABC transporter permease [unclassified Mesorhizobium]|uniref:amino acid ABC transporter permease n=1 Tax=unclassified Mesorhizobium TaxID=325217 RepID=UPI000FDA4F85|nr:MULTISPECIES: amino acid ABC transporter permease [unclassified Mesorhizobium]TGR40661.1 amino acid ABC transporter permease [bacterium M00.F.Ca.ET.199.01.1.1]TGU29362.1 amino acid ABC transporter permease [bacterium M00.F.Ca.ET.156.01.1.1]TGV85793.1 amino acid ABC transporter permease [Mesorhizobium sp. M00.F.Ca.ET.149.01.1.1]TGR25205.1 amino acid ABC transporter permease [Mesorhizobium sp. M8A.F.Ca.ET.197.01.1.1]TGR25658.1 amino acid ABC transporter permease [Mesorhizobium sp. M8A.F.Ca.ET